MPKYIARPVTVEAKRIVDIWPGAPGGVRLELEDGSTFTPDQGMLARMTPTVGDYVVTQADGYVYLNPAHVFERKYLLSEDEE